MKSVNLYGAPVVAAALLAVSAHAQDPPKAQPSSATAVTIAQLEENPDRYKGQNIRTSGEVQNILGPHLFTIDERNWVDFDGEILVFVPAPLAALVREDSPVTVAGTLRTMVEAEIDRERAWFGNDPDVRIELGKRPVLVADSLTHTQDNTNLTLRLQMDGDPKAPPPSGAKAVTDLGLLAKSDDAQMVGRWVDVQSARVSSVAKDGGFWVSVGEDRLFVVPAAAATKVTPGQTVGLRGVVLEFPEGMKTRSGDKDMAREEIYLYASEVTQSS